MIKYLKLEYLYRKKIFLDYFYKDSESKKFNLFEKIKKYKLIKKLKKTNLENTPWFTMKNIEQLAYVVDVYDGDTVTLSFKFGNGIYLRRCRLYGVDTPEIRTKDLDEKVRGLKAKDFVKDRILNKIVMMKCYGDDKYGRLLADIYVYENKKISEESLSEEIINKKFGVFYDGKKKN